MIVASFGRPLGAFQLDVDYKCGPKICYGLSPANQKKLEDFQKVVNAVAKKLGIKTYTKPDGSTDGFIGTNTVSQLQQIALRTAATTPVLGQFRTKISKETVTANVDALLVELQAILSPAGVPAVPPLPTIPVPDVPTPGMPPVPTPPTTPGPGVLTPGDKKPSTPPKTPPKTPPLPQPAKSNLGLIAGVIGGIAVLGTIIAIVAVKRSK